HKKLVELLNQLARHLVYQSDKITLNQIFLEITSYALYHFETEEGVWKKYLGSKDTWFLQHENEHKSFVTELLKLKAEEEERPIEVVLSDILSFLTHWLAFHILESDKKLAKAAKRVKTGLPLEQAKEMAGIEMEGVLSLLIDTILKMNDHLSKRTLELMREANKREMAEVKLRLASNVFENTLGAICILDSQFKVMEANPSFYQSTGFIEGELIGRSLSDSKSGFREKIEMDGFIEAVNESKHWNGIITNRRKTGEMEAEWMTLSAVKNSDGSVMNYVAIFSNVSHLMEQQAFLENIAHHDTLTGLPNRLLLRDRLTIAIAHSEAARTALAICYIDLDGFKPINDKYGHLAGDIVLKEIAKRLSGIVRKYDTVARLGGDEFVILLGDMKSQSDCIRVLNKVLDEVQAPIQIQNGTARVTASIGVTFFPEDASESDTLLHHADQAMYEAKKQGKNRYCFYYPI
ncbi:MAG TPA: diguanylate cyclase, partial [Leptospiraceae bacterium]|nr:diguanylate cyclase [Leptospiraceae bacterium]